MFTAMIEAFYKWNETLKLFGAIFAAPRYTLGNTWSEHTARLDAITANLERLNSQWKLK